MATFVLALQVKLVAACPPLTLLTTRMVISMQFSLSEGLCTKYLGGDRAEHYVLKKSKALVSVINIFFGFSP